MDILIASSVQLPMSKGCIKGTTWSFGVTQYQSSRRLMDFAKSLPLHSKKNWERCLKDCEVEFSSKARKEGLLISATM